MSDERLLSCAAGGDADAFARLYDRHAPAAFGVARRLCRDVATAEDVVQEAFLALWRSADRYDAARGSVRAYLVGTVRHRAIDTLRRTPPYELRPLNAPVACERTDDEAIRRADAGRVRAMVRALPTEQRHVVALAFFGGLTHQEIAVAGALPLGTVKGRLRLALRRLRAP